MYSILCNMRSLFILSTIFLVSAQTVSADEFRHRVEVEFKVPEMNFYVVSEGGWVGEVQRLIWRPDLNILQPIRGRTLEMGSAGAINVSAASEMALQSKDGDKIKLTVKLITPERNCDVFSFDGVNSGICELLPAASNKLRVALEVWPAAGGAAGYKPGLYHGIVSLSFESSL